MTHQRRPPNHLSSGVSGGLPALRTLKKNQFYVADFLAELSRAYAISAANKGLELFFSVAPDVPRVVAGNAARLRHILSQLLDNAVCYTDAGEIELTVVVTGGAGVPDGHKAVIRPGMSVVMNVTVRDTGKGIEPVRLESLMQARGQGKGGLAEVSHLVSLMDGRLSAVSQPGAGTAFTVCLPFEAVHPATSPVMPDFRGMPVLVVVQNERFAGWLETVLSAGGLRPDIVTDVDLVPAMLAAARDGVDPYGFIIIDVEMLASGEFDLIAHFRDAAPWLDRIIALLPPHELGKYLAHCHALGVMSCLPKPFSVRELHDMLLQACINNQMVYEEAIPEFDPERILIEMLWRHTVTAPRFHILLAEAVSAAQAEVTKVLEEAGHRVTVVSTGQAAVEACVSQRFDAVLMSLDVSGPSGLEAAQKILAQETCYRTQVWDGVQATPIIALTRRPDREEHTLCRDSGLSGYLKKPLDPALLLDTLQQVCDPVKNGMAGLRLAASLHDPQGLMDHYRSSDASTLMHQVMNLDDTREMFGGSTAVISQLLDVFFENFAQTLEDLKAAYAEEDLSRLARLAHTVKGSVGVFGAQRAAEAARRVETVARTADDPAAVRVPLMYLLQEMEDLSGALKAVAQKE